MRAVRTDQQQPAAGAPDPKTVCQPPPRAPAAAVPPPSWHARHFALGLSLILLAGLLAHGLILGDYVLHSPLARAPLNDAETYWDWAGRIASGQLLQHTPFFSAPLYPYLLGLVRALGGTLTTTYVLQMLARLATAFLLACVCRRRFGAGVGLLAAGLFLLLQEPASFSLRILTTSLQLVLVALTWAALVWLQARPTVARCLAAGLLLGLMCLADAAALLLVPVVAVWLFWQSSRRTRDAGRAALLVVAAGVAITPATLHNWHASGDFFLIRSASGLALLQGNQPGSQGVYTPVPGVSILRSVMHDDAARVYRAATGQRPTWQTVDRYFRDQALQYWRPQPLRILPLIARKLYLFLSSQNYGDIYQPASEIAAGQNRFLRLAPLPTPWLLAPALVGLVLLLRRPVVHAPEWLLFAAPLLVVAIFFFSPRYRAPALPLGAVLATYAIARALHVRTHRWTTVAVGAALAAGIALGPINQAAGLDLVDPSSAFFNLASAQYPLGQTEAALQNWRAGLKLAPADADRRITLGDALLALGRSAEALAEFQAARAQRPDDPPLLVRIATVLCQQRRMDAAGALLTEAVARHPADPDLLAALADVHEALGQVEQSHQLYARALAAAPDHAALRFAYGRSLARQGRWAEARAELAQALKAEPYSFEARGELGRVCAQMGDFPNSRLYLNRALQLQPRSLKTLFDLGAVSAAQGQPADAADYFRRALVVDPNDARCRAALEQVERAARTPGR